MGDYVWEPSAEVVEHANVTRLMRRLGCADFHALLRLSVDEPDRFWPAVVEDLGLEFSRPWEARARRVPRGRVGALVRRAAGSTWRGTASTAGRPSEGEAARLAAGGRRRGARSRGPSSRGRCTCSRRASPRSGSARATSSGSSCRWRPRSRSPRTRCAHLGAVQVPIFSGFAAHAIAARLADARREGADHAPTARCAAASVVPMKEIADEALRAVPSVEHVVVWRRLGADVPMTAGATSSGTSSSRAARAPWSRSRSTRRRRTCSRTPPARPAARRAYSTSRAAFSSRSRARRRTSPTSTRATASTSRPTWAGSWGRGPWSAAARPGRRSSTRRARPTGPPTGSGSSSSRSG